MLKCSDLHRPKQPKTVPSSMLTTQLLACRRWENWMAARKRKGMAFFHLLLETRWSLLHVLLARSLTWPDLVVFWKERSLTRPSPFFGSTKYNSSREEEMMIDCAAAAAAAVGCISKDLPIKYVFLFRSWKIPLISKDKIVVQFGKMIKFMQSNFLLFVLLLLFVC